MPDKRKKRGTVVPGAPTANGAPSGNQPSNNLQATTSMGVPIAPDNLIEVTPGLFEKLRALVQQRDLINAQIRDTAHSAALILGATSTDHVVLSADMRYIAVYHQASIEKADAEAAASAAAEPAEDNGE
jgi:hypothetical protein